MAKTFRLQTTVKEMKPLKLFKMFTDSDKHTEICGVKTKIDLEKMTFTSKDVKGKILKSRAKQFVMDYTCKSWPKGTQPSIVTVSFKDVDEGNTLVEIYHSNVEDDFVEAMKRGWKEKYFKGFKGL